MLSRSTPKLSCWLAVAVAAAVLLSTTAQAVAETQFQRVFVVFSQARGGDDGAIDKAADGFEKLRRAEPTNPVVMAYAGAATTLKATTTWLPWKKMSYAEDGMAMIDKALAMLAPVHNAVMQNGTPGALEVRFVASTTFLAVPGFMNRGARGAKLLAEVLTSPLLAQSPLSFQGAVWLRAAALAQAEKRPEDARKYLNKVINSKAPQAGAARAQLKALTL